MTLARHLHGRIVLMREISSDTGDPVGNPLQLDGGVRRKGGLLRKWREQIRPTVELGYLDQGLHRPLGEHRRDGRMDFDSRMHLRRSEWAHVEDDLFATLDESQAEYPDLRWWLYFGAHSIEQEGMLERGELLTHYEHEVETLKGLAGRRNVVIVLDQTPGESVVNGHPHAGLVELARTYCRAAGGEVFLEPAPRVSDPAKSWAHAYPSYTSAALSIKRAKDPARRKDGDGWLSAEYYNPKESAWSGIDRPPVREWLADAVCRKGVVPVLYPSAMDAAMAAMTHDQLVAEAVGLACVRELTREEPREIQSAWRPAVLRYQAKAASGPGAATEKKR